ncbi:hypothetical protein [Nonomuraea endophytica]|uniref:Uncharacterized protein n=1 Tax=Nonomuraea endophytica TaxID=714136 RepID=A0A7W8EJP4_9ACTN|nr:hypothetical protein [Nonomuraea endophytica]MBB5081788.1 hypothetical protein [Nonomuraea endophytica]
MSGRQLRVVVDPTVPDQAADLLRLHRRLLVRVRGGWAPPRRRRRAGRTYTIFQVVMWSSVSVAALALFRAYSYGAFAFLFVGVMLLMLICLLMPERDPEAEKQLDVYECARKYQGRFVLREDLDEAARALMSRAHCAIDTVTESRVNAEGLLDGARNAVMLPAQEWEIARLLSKLSGLRSEHREVMSEGVTPEVLAVSEPLSRVLESSERAVIDRVEALERYAGHVRDAERAYRARSQIEQFTAKLPRYEELLAESGADGQAVPELTELADDAGRLEQALRDSVSSAHEAFRHLES